MSALILSVLAILILDALISASEAAIFSVPLHRARLLAEKSRFARPLLALKESMERPITALIAMSNLVTIVGSVLTGIIVAKLFGAEWVGIFAAVLTFIIMIFAEIIPKRLGERYAEAVGLFAAPLVQGLALIFSPVVWLIRKITEPFSGKKKTITSEEEISFLARLGGKEGIIEEDESQLIQRVFRLNDITAGDMMTPKSFVHFLDGSRTVGEVAEYVKSGRHSRLPVFENDKNTIVGIAHQCDLLKAIADGELARPVKAYIRDALFVPDTLLADELLRKFQEHRTHLAVVVSEYGNVVGVVGLEDVLEELVGELIEEKDVAPELIKRVARNEILVHGQTRIPNVNHFFNTGVKSKKTVNGFLLEKFGRLPEKGEKFEYDSLIFVVEEASPRSIEKVRIIKKELTGHNE